VVCHCECACIKLYQIDREEQLQPSDLIYPLPSRQLELQVFRVVIQLSIGPAASVKGAEHCSRRARGTNGSRRSTSEPLAAAPTQCSTAYNPTTARAYHQQDLYQCSCTASDARVAPCRPVLNNRPPASRHASRPPSAAPSTTPALPRQPPPHPHRPGRRSSGSRSRWPPLQPWRPPSSPPAPLMTSPPPPTRCRSTPPRTRSSPPTPPASGARRQRSN